MQIKHFLEGFVKFYFRKPQKYFDHQNTKKVTLLGQWLRTHDMRGMIHM